MREFDAVIEIVESLDAVYYKMEKVYGSKKAIEYFAKRCKLLGKYLKEAKNVKKTEEKSFSKKGKERQER